MKKLILLIGIVQLTSCGMLWEYRGLNELDDWTWNKSDIQHFDAEISKPGNYDVYVILRHIHGFPYADVNLNLKINGTNASYDQSFTIPVINSDKEYLGEGSGDMWDIEFQTLENEPFDPGTYSVDIQHEMLKEDLQLMMEVGILFKASEE